MSAITEKAMLVRHIIRRKDFRKFDRKVSEEVAEKHGTQAAKSGRYNKILIGREFLKSINQAADRAYDHHIAHTLPWEDSGSRLLPAAHYFSYMDAQREYREQFDAAVDSFMTEYPSMIEEARERLGDMFRSDDYPVPEALVHSFSITVSVTPVPDADDFRVALSRDEVERIRADVESRMQAVTQAAVRDLFERLSSAVEVMRDRLRSYQSDETRRFFRSWVDNVIEIADLIPSLNFTDDPELDGMRRRVAEIAKRHEPEKIKSDASAAAEVSAAADAVLADMAAYLGG